jgi:hypothetical protein
VADERLYQLKNGARNVDRTSARPPANAQLPDAGQQEPPATEPSADPPAEPQIQPPISSPVSSRMAQDERNPGIERRRWERVSLANTHAYALIGEGVERTARVLDLGYGGIALESSRPDEFDDLFHAVLHVPILPPVRVSLRRVYRRDENAHAGRIGCAFVT